MGEQVLPSAASLVVGAVSAARKSSPSRVGPPQKEIW